MVQVFNACVGLSQKVLGIGPVYIYWILKMRLVRVHVRLGFTHIKSLDDLIHRHVGLSDHV